MTLGIRVAAALLLTAGVGCTANNGQTYRSADWKAGRPLGKVLVIVPDFPADSASQQPTKNQRIHDAVRQALEQFPGTTVIDDAAESPAPVSEAQAIAAARSRNADTACIVTLGQFGGRYLLTALPPGWDSRTTVQYSLRLLDAKTGGLLMESVRERTTGGYLAIMTPSYPADLRADLTSVLSTR